MDKQLFVKTTDASTYELLLSEGFKLVSFDGTVWTFLNDKSKSISFKYIQISTLIFSNILRKEEKRKWESKIIKRY